MKQCCQVVAIFFIITGLFISYAAIASDPAPAPGLEVAEAEQNLSFSMKETEDGVPGLGKLVAVFVIVIALATVVIAVLKRSLYRDKQLFSGAASVISVEASKRLSVKTTVHLVSIEGVKYIVVEKENAISILPHQPLDQLEEVS